MLSVIIPTLDAERTLPRTLACLVAATVQGLVREVILADGGSRDQTALIAEETGAHFVAASREPGDQLRAGAAAARSNWLLVLQADTALDPGWAEEVSAFIGACERLDPAPERAGVFRFVLDDFGSGARWAERLVALSTHLGRPSGDQALVIPKRFFERLGGRADFVRAIGRRRLVPLRTAAVADAARYGKRGAVLGLIRAGAPRAAG